MSVYQFVGRDGFVSWREADGQPRWVIASPPRFPILPIPRGRAETMHPDERREFILTEVEDRLGVRWMYVEDGVLPRDRLALADVETVLTALVGIEFLLRQLAPLGEVITVAHESIKKALATAGAWPYPGR